MLGYEYHPAAEAEYHTAIRYYSRISAELGISFVSEIEMAVERARLFPEAHQTIHGHARRARRASRLADGNTRPYSVGVKLMLENLPSSLANQRGGS